MLSKIITSALAVSFSILSPAASPAAPLPQFVSSDATHDARLNDLFIRHMRIDNSDQSLRSAAHPGLVPTAGQTLWKLWEVDSMLWFDYSTTNLPLENRPALLSSALQMPIDRFGYVYTAATDSPVPPTTAPGVYFGLGWPFPDYDQSFGNSVGYEWNSGTTTGGWSISNAITGGVSNGQWYGSTTHHDPQLISPTFSVNSLHAPILSLSIQYDSIDPNMTDPEKRLQIFWQTAEEPYFSESKSVFSRDFPTIPVENISTSPIRRLYFPMHLHSKWNGQTITRLRIDPITSPPGSGRSVSWRLDYCRLSYDTRHNVNNPVFILAAARKFFWDGNTNELRNQLPRMRSAMQFMLTHMRGDELYLLDQSFFVGHEGLGFTTPSNAGRRVGRGIGTNYYDLLPCGPRDLHGNVYFYKALQAMAEVEAYVEANPWLDSPKPTVFGPDGVTTVTYAEDSASLSARLEDVRESIHNEFWNPATGRYGAWRDINGRLVDYGYLHFNAEALEAGIPPSAEAQQILDWMNGTRIVAGDTSTGADIYNWEFAGRVSTRRNLTDYFWEWQGWTVPWGEQIQDGGAVLWTTFYDVGGRIRYGDIDGAWTVWNRMLQHHQKVMDFGGKGENFYRDYYAANPGSLQGGGTAGGLGLDVEFIENSMTPAAWRAAWMGIEAIGPRHLLIAPTLPPALDHIGIRNVTYRGNTINMDHQVNRIDLSSSTISNPDAGFLRLRFRTDSPGTANILKNGQPVAEPITRTTSHVQIDVVPEAAEWTLTIPTATETFSVY